jgi:hypothetical protein
VPLGEVGCDIVKTKVEDGREPEEDELDKEGPPKLDDLMAMFLE